METNLIESRDRFLRFIRSKVSDPVLAEDILQDSILKALRSAPELQDEERFVPWFYRILRNGIVDAYRARGKETHRIVPLDDIDVEEDEEEVAALCECFRDLLPTVKLEYAQVIEAELREESSDVTVARLGINQNNLKVRRHRARQALRSRLEETCRVCADHGCLDCTCR